MSVFSSKSLVNCVTAKECMCGIFITFVLYFTQVGSFDEHGSQFYSAEIILALEYLHNLGIIHRSVHTYLYCSFHRSASTPHSGHTYTHIRVRTLAILCCMYQYLCFFICAGKHMTTYCFEMKDSCTSPLLAIHSVTHCIETPRALQYTNI